MVCIKYKKTDKLEKKLKKGYKKKSKLKVKY